ncbi:MAG: 4Fe-4S dicluster domain-containing protein [Gemmatimonadaceae bacterium]|nr:4Fe-4S dicluster domain-containing protein [Gemmatimonadaceae bacterium]
MSTDTTTRGVDRRRFLKVLGATGATTTIVGCDTDGIQRLVPYLQNPDQTVPGVSTYYATTCRECAAACGLIAETRDGRVIKVEGNPNHPVNQGAVCARGQSGVQGLYNPDRFRGPMVREGGALKPISWDKALELLGQKLGEARSKGVAKDAIFFNQHEAGSFPAFLDQWLANFGMPAHLSVDLDAELPVIAGNKAAYGAAWPALDFGAASLVLSFSADFLDTWGQVVPQQLGWADARAKLEGAPRHVYIGPRRSLTGLNADEWIPASPGSELEIARFLRGAISADEAAKSAGVKPAQLERLKKDVAKAGRGLLAIAGATTPNATDIAIAVAELNKAAGSVGNTIKPSESIGNYDRLATFSDIRAAVEKMAAGSVPLVFVRGTNLAYALPTALKAADALGKVAFKVAFTNVPDETAMLADLILPDHHGLESWGDADAPGGKIALQQPAMEPVFDTRATADVLITLAKADVGNASKYPAENYRAWLTARLPGGASAMVAALPNGIATGSTLKSAAPAHAAPKAAPALGESQGEFFVHVYPSALLGADGRGANKPWLQELPDPVSKVAWQSWVEIHPLTARKLGLREHDVVEVKTAQGSIQAPVWPYLGVREDVVAIATGRGHTGYGRYAQNVGVNAMALLPVAEEGKSGGLVFTATKGSVSKVGRQEELVTTEGSARQHDRGIGQAVTVAELSKLKGRVWRDEPKEKYAENNPVEHHGAEGGEHGADAAAEGDHGAALAPALGAFAGKHGIAGNPDPRFERGLKSPVAADAQGELAPTGAKGKDQGLYDPNNVLNPDDPTDLVPMAKRRWAMTIDLAKCTGCSACVTACYSENNIPTVGAPWQGRTLLSGAVDARPGANILKGREMAWIRLERYFEGGEDGSSDFDTRFVPMMCQHCGNAPCEPVCPVYATYHSPDGLNVQVYNRCVGTRYCSNNCPYKVRYFNWFGFGEPDRRQYAFPEPLNWQLNPDVTVRGKGVMEKCTFCVQRIREAENRSQVEGTALQGDSFTTACAQACPSRAIVFGDAADTSWTVSKLVEDKRAYHVFEELNTFTAVVYLKKVNHIGDGQINPSSSGGAH